MARLSAILRSHAASAAHHPAGLDQRDIFLGILSAQLYRTVLHHDFVGLYFIDEERYEPVRSSRKSVMAII